MGSAVRRLIVALALVLSVAAPAHAWSLIGQKSGVGTTAAISTTGADLIVLNTGDNNGSTTAPSDSTSATWTCGTIKNFGSSEDQLCFTWNASGSGHTSGTHTFTCGGSFCAISVLAFSGSQTSSSPFDAASAGNGNTSASGTPGSLTISSGELYVTGMSADGMLGTLTINGGFSTPEWKDLAGGSNYTGGISYFVSTGSAANPTWTLGASVDWNSNMMGFKAGGGAVAPTVCQLLLLGVGGC